MINILNQEELDEFIEILNKQKNVVIKGPTGSGKSTFLLEYYKDLINNKNIASEKILLLVLNRIQSLTWRKKTTIEVSSNIWRTSYYGFIQNEISTYYPIVLNNCKEIETNNLRPVFLTFEISQYLVTKVIDKKRDKEELFRGLTSFSDKISIDLVANIVKAATSSIPYNQIGDRLYNSLENKSEERRNIFSDADTILKTYRKRCLELGVLDFGMAVDIYNKYLLTDENYINSLKNRIDYVIVDNVEEIVPTEADLLNTLKPYVDSMILSYNHEGGYGEIFGSNITYITDNLIHKFHIVEFNKFYNCNEEMYKFSELLYSNIINDSNIKSDFKINIERVSNLELRSDMLDSVGERVIKLIKDEEYLPQDIVLISTYADPVTEYVVERKLITQGYSINNISRKENSIDNLFTKSLLTLAKLCHPKYTYWPNVDDVRELLKLILKIDHIRASILAHEICNQRPFATFPDVEFPGIVERVGYYNLEKYNTIKNWIDEYKNRKNELPINEFLQKIFLEILISNEITETDIIEAKNLIDSSKTFYDVIRLFDMNPSKEFIQMMTKGTKSAESIIELEEKLERKEVKIVTPMNFLASSISAKVVILLGISSTNWTPRNIKDMTNSHVLTKTWKDDEVYTEEIEEQRQKDFLAMMLRNIVKKTGEKLITFESEYSANGFENEGILSRYFDEIF